MKTWLTLFIFLCSFSPLYAVKLQWKIPAGDRVEITRTARVRFFSNRRMQRVYEERNIIDLTSQNLNSSGSFVKGVFTIFHRESGNKTFHQRERYESDFTIENNGRFLVPGNNYMPNLRHVPSFPDRDVNVGDAWKSTAELVLNNFSIPFKLLFPAAYRIEDIRKEKDRTVVQIKYQFNVEKKLNPRRFPRDFPLKISGRNEGIILWDATKNRPISFKDKYRIFFFFNAGRGRVASREFQMLIESEPKVYARVTKDDEKRAKKEIEKELPEDSGIEVDSDKRGIVLRMGEVLFDFDSFALRPDVQKTLEVIAGIIRKKYPDREIIVEGHTDHTGKRPYNLKLSEKRSKAVTEFLQERSGHDKLSFKGYGPDRPIANNRTKKGRSKNRRVEIIIKLR